MLCQYNIFFSLIFASWQAEDREEGEKHGFWLIHNRPVVMQPANFYQFESVRLKVSVWPFKISETDLKLSATL